MSSSGSGSSSGGVAPSYVDLGLAVDFGASANVTLTLSDALPAGALVVAVLAGRGAGTVDVEDSANNLWILDAESTNGSGASTVAVYECVLDNALPVGASITGTFSSASDRAQAIVGMWLRGVTGFDRAGVNSVNGTTLTVDTGQPLRGNSGVAVAAFGTGLASATNYAGFAPFEQTGAFGSSLSSGVFLVRVGTGWGGQPLDVTAVADQTAQHAGVLVVFR